MWFEHEQLAALFRTLEMEASSPLNEAKVVGESELECLNCGALMNRHNLGQLFRKIKLDACSEHGVWFDAEELLKTLEKLAPDSDDSHPYDMSFIGDDASDILIKLLSRRKGK